MQRCETKKPIRVAITKSNLDLVWNNNTTCIMLLV